MDFSSGLIGLIPWPTVIGALVLMALLAVWMVQARTRRIPPQHRRDTQVPQDVTGQGGEGAR